MNPAVSDHAPGRRSLLATVKDNIAHSHTRIAL